MLAASKIAAYLAECFTPLSREFGYTGQVYRGSGLTKDQLK